ncbi:MAG: hypothetical protein GPJ16_24620 [Microcystis aeruginosa G11-04]|jgi:hypothetical protein|uniref:Uncharacterized protein n=1 Tax=Microcystis aeruginosa G11-04 TaxID=2685956 RepID=A0A966G3M6_MICAE|nr:hypothetical protein [Microcystis aeruginosa G11-04]
MAENNPDKKTEDWARRWSQVTSLFQEVEKEIELAKNQGKRAPNGCWIVRYRARGKGGTYWYYKWQSPEPIFVTKDGKKSCHKYIGKAGSPAFVEAVEMMLRRTKIESLQQVRHTLELGLSDLIEEATRDEK